MNRIRILGLIATTLISASALAADPFVRVQGNRFSIDGKRYQYLGANFWAGMHLGATSEDKKRLLRELDRMAGLGITNLRIIAAAEGPDTEPWRISPSLQPRPGVFDERYLEGLDTLLAEMSKRKMRAVVCLNNFWPWSGGMSQYLRWAGADPIPYPPPQKGGSWDTYQSYVQKFYSDPKAVALANDAVKKIVTRMNHATGVKYSDDPTIMAWQLANEPRAMSNRADFNLWVDRTAGLIKSLDPNHLVTTGVEGETPWPSYAGLDFEKNHASRNIDYATVHIWVQNWGWYDPSKPETFGPAVTRMKSYLESHLDKIRKLGKPVVLEEFGLARDQNSYDPNSPATVRDRYYREVFEEVYQQMKSTTAMAGVNFWAWAGEGFPKEPGGYWKPGFPFTGDPPHEAQGWYSVYNTDLSTLAVISEYARKISGLR